MQIRSAFAKEGGVLKMQITIENNTTGPLSGFAIQFNKNSFGLVPESPTAMGACLPQHIMPGQSGDKMISVVALSSAYAPTVAPAPTVARATAPSMMDLSGLKDQAKKLNPVVGYFDPLNLAEGEFWGDSTEATIGFLRESEIKHGRIAMFGFVGYIVHANGIHWPWKGPWESIPTDVSPQEMWDLTPEAAKWQIILTIGFLEFWRENAYVLKADGEAHYMRGGKPGYFPTFDNLPHPAPFNLYDPFKLSKNASPEKKAKGLLTEVNNGRLAMIGLFGFLAESAVPGSVPGLSSVGLKAYSGNIMAPFDANFHIF
jgi:hypothetical protein